MAQEKKQKSTKPLKLSEWIALCEALEASPDISPRDLATKARQLVESRKKYARAALSGDPK